MVTNKLYTAKERHQHRKGLRQRINECHDPSFCIKGDLPYVANRYGDTVITGRAGELTLDGKQYRLEELEVGVVLYTTPLSL